MGKVGLQQKGTTNLPTRSSVVDSDLIVVYDAATQTPKTATITQLNAGGVLDSNNTWSGTNDFTGGISIGGVDIDATALEINAAADDSLNLETVTEAGAISVTKRNTNFDSTGGTFAATLAACPATMIGKIKTIRMAVDNGDVTIALTNVQGGTAASTATFDAVGEELVLIGSAGGKWTVVKEFGVTLS